MTLISFALLTTGNIVPATKKNNSNLSVNTPTPLNPSHIIDRMIDQTVENLSIGQPHNNDFGTICVNGQERLTPTERRRRNCKTSLQAEPAG